MALYFLEDNSKPSFREKFSSAMQGVNRLAGAYGQLQQEKKQASKLKDLTGMDLEGLSPELQKLAFAAKLENTGKMEQLKQKQEQQKNILKSIYGETAEEPAQRFAEEVNQPAKTQVNQQATPQSKPAFDFEDEDLTYNKIPKPKLIPDIEIAQIALTDPALARELREQNNQKLNQYNKEIDRAYDIKKTARKESFDRSERLQKETQPIRMDYADKGATALESIRRKEQANELIDRGNLDDPTFAAIAEAIPFNLGKRLLSPDTVEYKSGMVDDFKDLKNIFTGTTRVVEIDILKDKVADIYLTNAQKKAVLKSRINALRADVIKAEVAAELEIEQQDNPTLGAAAFRNEVEKRAKKQLDGLASQIIDENKAIIQAAENKKKIPLDPDDPEDKEILNQILNEAGGDKNEARKIAKQKGYQF
jgi:6-pyruvoyl-tetrahydropterin synthase